MIAKKIYQKCWLKAKVIKCDITNGHPITKLSISPLVTRSKCSHFFSSVSSFFLWLSLVFTARPSSWSENMRSRCSIRACSKIHQTSRRYKKVQGVVIAWEIHIKTLMPISKNMIWKGPSLTCTVARSTVKNNMNLQDIGKMTI